MLQSREPARPRPARRAGESDSLGSIMWCTVQPQANDCLLLNCYFGKEKDLAKAILFSSGCLLHNQSLFTGWPPCDS